MNEQPETILVMAGSFEQFELYRRSRGLAPDALIYLHRLATARRSKGAVLVKTGNWNRRRDWRAIDRLAADGHFAAIREEETVPPSIFSRRGN